LNTADLIVEVCRSGRSIASEQAVAKHMERRRHLRTSANIRPLLERALGSWVSIRTGWQSVFDLAQSVRDWQRVALAESKVDDCRHQIARLEELLRNKGS
jgi:hypothetical protein